MKKEANLIKGEINNTGRIGDTHKQKSKEIFNSYVENNFNFKLEDIEKMVSKSSLEELTEMHDLIDKYNDEYSDIWENKIRKCRKCNENMDSSVEEIKKIEIMNDYARTGSLIDERGNTITEEDLLNEKKANKIRYIKKNLTIICNDHLKEKKKLLSIQNRVIDLTLLKNKKVKK